MEVFGVGTDELTIKDTAIKVSDILGIVEASCKVILRSKSDYLEIADDKNDMLSDVVIGVTLCKKDYRKVKFEFIKYIKTLSDPEDRVDDSECKDENGVMDFAKRDRLIESRKTREERDLEFAEEIQIKKDCERFGIEYFGVLQ